MDPPACPVRLLPLAGPLALVGAAFIWGSSHLVAQAALVELSVPLLLALRFSVAALLLVLVRGPTPRAAWTPGLGLGLLFFAMYAAHTHGLTGTTAAKAAFIMGSGALLVPFLGLCRGERPAPGAFSAAALGVSGLGVMLLSWPLHLAAGDGWQLLAAGLFAAYLRGLGQVPRHHSALALLFPQLCVMAALAWVWALPHLGELARLTPPGLAAVLYLGVFANLVVMGLQAFALRVVPPERAALWLLLEPVFTLILAGLLGRAAPTPNVLLGGAVVLSALALSHHPQAGQRWVRVGRHPRADLTGAAGSSRPARLLRHRPTPGKVT